MSDPNTPDWVRDAVFYQIFPDRFASSPSVPKPSGIDAWGSVPTFHGYQGGDLVGVAEKLDYLQDLGVTAIYFTPIFQSASNHRYHTHDYSRVDPMLGGDAALKRLLHAAHSRGMRVVHDGVFNHASRGFFQFHDILENGSNSAYLDWFIVKGYPLYAYDPDRAPNYGAWWGLPALPKFNVQTPAVREFLFGVARHWVDFGIDGWRLDVANEIDDDDFWREFRRRVLGCNPETYIVGEVWQDARRWLKGDMWDAVMNYLFTHACISFFIGGGVDESELKRTCLFPAGAPGASAFAARIAALLKMYHPNVSNVMLNLLDDSADFDSATREQSKATRQIERPLPTLPVQFGTVRTKGVVEKMEAIEILFADVTAPSNAQAINEVFVFRIDCHWRRFCFEGSRRTRLFQLPRCQWISDSRASQALFVFRLLSRNRGLLTLLERPHQSFSRLAIRADNAFGRLRQPTTVVTRKPTE